MKQTTSSYSQTAIPKDIQLTLAEIRERREGHKRICVDCSNQSERHPSDIDALLGIIDSLSRVSPATSDYKVEAQQTAHDAQTLVSLFEVADNEVRCASKELESAIAELVVRAKHDERERCVRIVKAHRGHGAWCGGLTDDCQSLTVDAIATAIDDQNSSK